MTNSFFNYIESPDYASTLEDSYRSLNESFDRAEGLERENDKTREINAAMPMKMIEALADFSITAKQAADKLAMERFLNNESEPAPEEGTEQHKALNKLNYRFRRSSIP